MTRSEVSGFDGLAAGAAEQLGVFPVDVEGDYAPAVLAGGCCDGLTLVSAAFRADGLTVVGNRKAWVAAGPGVRVLSEISR